MIFFFNSNNREWTKEYNIVQSIDLYSYLICKSYALYEYQTIADAQSSLNCALPRNTMEVFKKTIAIINNTS